MKRKNLTRNALFTSIISLLLCVSMLVGTTFAWFTDTVVSGNNVIAAGNLDIELEYAVLNEDGTVKEWKTVNGATNLFSNALWEPGHTQVVYLKLSNLGTLALKYQLGINIASENGGINVAGNPFKLSDHIYMGVVENAAPTFVSREKAIEEAQKGANGIIGNGYAKSGSMTADAEDLYMAVVVYMPTTVGNEANYKTGTNRPEINLGINLFATQLEAEPDSFGTDYDKDAVWTGVADTTWYNTTDKEFVLTSAEDLAGLAQIVNEGTDTFAGKTVSLGADIDVNNVNWTPIGVGSNRFEGTFIGTGYTISNLRVVGEKALGLFGKTFTGAHIEGITIDTAYVSGNDYVGAILGQGYLGHNCIKDCTVIDATIIATPYYDSEKGVYDGGAKAGVIAGQAYNGNITGCVVKNSTVTAYRDLGGIAGMHDFDGKAGSTVEASGNTVENVTLSYVGVAGKYDGDKPNQNMAEVVGRIGANATVGANTITNVTMNEANKGATMIFTLDELIAFAKDVNAGNTYKGKTVILGADIDMLNMDWTPIGNSTNKFQGTFDGNCKTISNLKINMAGKSNVGLFGMTTDGEIKNLTVENAIVTGRLNVGVVAGTPYTTSYSNITVKGHVEVNGMAYVGGVGGKNAYANWDNITVDVDETSYVNANSVENGTAYRTYVGGVVGFNGEGGHSFTNITSNINVIGSTCDVGGAFGIAHYGNKFENVKVTGNVTITDAAEAADAEEMGGIAGVWHNGGDDVTFTDCKFDGVLTANITEGVDLSDNTIVGAAYSATGAGNLVITNYVEEDGITYALDGVSGEKTLYLVPADYEGTTVNIPEGVDTIGGYAFAYNKNIETIVLPDSVTTLNDRAFRDTSASTVVLNEGLTNISYQAFRNASNVTSVVIPSTVTTISKEAFQNSGVKELVIPANVTTIEYGGLRDMKELEKVTIEGNVDIPIYAFRACTKLTTVILNGDNVTFGGGNSKGMIFTNKENGDGSAITVTVANEVIKARLLAADTAAKDYGGYTIICKQTTATDENGESLGYYVDEGTATTYDAKGLSKALEDENVETVVLAEDVTVASADAGSNAYGATGINVKNGQTFDGNGNSFGVNKWGTWDSAISTTGGVIKNVTINQGMRGIFVNHNSSNSEQVVLENVVVDGTVYTISCDQGTNQGLKATNCTFNGWTSYAATIGNVEFINCSFGEGQGYNFSRPYAPTSYVGCNFEAGHQIDPRAAVTFENCTIDGVALTAENLATLVTFNIANATVK